MPLAVLPLPGFCPFLVVRHKTVWQHLIKECSLYRINYDVV